MNGPRQCFNCPQCGRECKRILLQDDSEPEEEREVIRKSPLSVGRQQAMELDHVSSSRSSKAEVESEEEEDDVHALPALRLGEEPNQLRFGWRSFRFAFWNLENFTADRVRQGPRVFQNDLTSERNIVRLQFVAMAIVALDLDALALMELGSDAERVLVALVAEITKLDPHHQWNSVFSELTGSVVSPPPMISLQLPAFGETRERIAALEALLPYYDLVDGAWGVLYPGRRIYAHRLIARRSDRERITALDEVLLELKNKDGCTHEDIERLLPEVLDRNLDEYEARDHEAMLALFNPDNAKGRPGLLLRLLEGERYFLVAIFLVLSGARIELHKNQTVILTDGPRQALRYFGYNPGRYERYGIVFRTGLHEVYLRNTLVQTKLLQEGLPTNSRAAMAFQMPLGAGGYLMAYLIHSMYSPILKEGEKLKDKESRALRVQTLLAQADHARQQNPLSRPLFIMGDTNINSKDLDEANKGMLARGYRRLGDLAVSTTLRREPTLRSAFTPSGEYFSQPYDAVYQDADRMDRFPADVSYPFRDCLQDLWFWMLSANDSVRNWYFLLLRERYRAIYYLGQKQQDGHVITAIAKAAIQAKLKRDAPDSVLYTRESGRTFLTLLFDEFAGFETVEDDTEASSCSVEDEDDNEDEIDDNKLEEDAAKKEKKARVRDHVRAYLRLRPSTLRAFTLFFRHFVSDHRLVMLTLQYWGLVGQQRTQRSAPRTWTPLATAVTQAGFRKQGSARGVGLSCFLYSLLQLVAGNENQDDAQVAALRSEMALRGAIPVRGFVDAGSVLLASYLANHPNFQGYTIRVWGRNTNDGTLQLRHTINHGATVIDMLLEGNHFTPLWT